MGKALPYKIVDSCGQNRYGVVVSSLQGLIKKGKMNKVKKKSLNIIA